MPKPILKAIWHPGRDCWIEPEVDIFGHSAAWSETLPRSGMTHGGRLFEPPMLGHRIIGREFSCLPTPLANEHKWAGDSPGIAARVTPPLSSVGTYFPTPQASDWKRENNPSDNRRKSPSITAVDTHFPTPTAADGTGGKYNSTGHQSSLPGTVRELAESSGVPTPPLFGGGSD